MADADYVREDRAIELANKIETALNNRPSFVEAQPKTAAQRKQARDNTLSQIKSVDTIADLRLLDVAEQSVYVNGSFTPGDGGEGRFISDGSTGHTAAEDDGVLKLVSDAGLLYEKADRVGLKAVFFADLQPDANPSSGPDQVAKTVEFFERLKANHGNSDYGFFVGDLVDRGYPTAAEEAANTVPWYTFNDIRKEIDAVPINISTLLGNHDVDYRPGAVHPHGNTFIEGLNSFERQYYWQRFGNIVVINMSNFHDATASRIPDYIVDWWEKICLAHKDCFIITNTHAPLQGALYYTILADTATTGTGPVTMTSILGDLYLNPTSLTDGEEIHLRIVDGNEWEISKGIVSNNGFTVTRSLITSSTGSLLNLTGNAQVFTLPRDESVATWEITESERFYDRMLRADDPVRVDAWFSGHVGTRMATHPERGHTVGYGGTHFFNCGLHIPAWAEGGADWDMTYITLEATNGSNEVKFRRFNHETEEYIDDQEVTLTVPGPIKVEKTFRYDGRYQMDERFATYASPQNIMVPYNRVWNEDRTAAIEDLGPHVIQNLGLYDTQKSALNAGLEIGQIITVPGGVSTIDGLGLEPDPTDGLRNYGIGTGLIARRISEADVSYATDAYLRASTSGRDMDSLTQGLGAHHDETYSSLNGERPHWISPWTEIDAATAPTSGTDFVHNLGADDVEVIVKFRESGTQFPKWNWGMSSCVSTTTAGNRYDGSVFEKDNNTVSIAVGNDGVFAVDNAIGAATTNFTVGEFQVIVKRLPTVVTEVL